MFQTDTLRYRQPDLNSGRVYNFATSPKQECFSSRVLFSWIYQRQISEIRPSQAKVSAKVKGLTAAV